ncbi:MAG TPA: CDP-diacylglycerol--serine O-phosphatidyltransferase [Gemmataceae bacterium]|nr:CDP-diacylglycerol--serine O-phosphatidyltransferase [Gemmataceae bacterium]
MKKIAVLPTLLTLGNGICGFVAITFISKISADGTGPNDPINFGWAGWFILFAMIFDMLDGYVARLSKSASDFGGELDSLCDVVSFGVTPAFLLIKLGPTRDDSELMHMLLAGIAALYFSCTALRLARFNVANDTDASSHKKFQGLPSPGAAGCIAALAILRGEFAGALNSRIIHGIDLEAAQVLITRIVEIASPICALVVALLMVSNVAYPHVTGKIFSGRKTVWHLVQVFLAAFILIMFRSLAPLLIFWIYAFVFPLRALVVRNLREAEPHAPPVDEHLPHKL